MNKIKLAMNVWRAYSVARHTEGSSLRGMIMSGASIAAVVAITVLRGDLTAADVGYIAAGVSGLDAVLKYFIPDQLGVSDDLPPIELVGKSASGWADAQPSPSPVRTDPAADQLRRPVRPHSNTVESTDHDGADFPGWGS